MIDSRWALFDDDEDEDNDNSDNNNIFILVTWSRDKDGRELTTRKPWSSGFIVFSIVGDKTVVCV